MRSRQRIRLCLNSCRVKMTKCGYKIFRIRESVGSETSLLLVPNFEVSKFRFCQWKGAGCFSGGARGSREEHEGAVREQEGAVGKQEGAGREQGGAWRGQEGAMEGAMGEQGGASWES